MRVADDRDDPLNQEARQAFAGSITARPDVGLRHSSAEIRSQAMTEVQVQPETDAAGEVARLLRNDADEALREKAALTLGRLGTPEALDALGACSEERSPVVRRGILNGIQRIGGTSAQTFVVAFLSDPDWSIRQQAQEFLSDTGWTPASRRETALLAIAQGRMDEAIEQGPEAVDPLVDTALYVTSTESRQWAVVALSQVRSDGIVQRLEMALDSADETIAANARHALAVIRPARPQHESHQPGVRTGRQPDVDQAFAAALQSLAIIGEP